MGIFSNDGMAKSNKNAEDAAAPGADAEKPLPEPKRPGTSGTEMMLTTTRRQASAKLKAASQAERAYKAKKRSAAARANLDEAKGHFGETFKHMVTGSKLMASVVRSVPYIFSNKAEQRRAKAAESKRAAALEKRKKLEEKLAKEKEVADALAAENAGEGPSNSS
ncbi:hypothetical protein PpBr36_01740 [Pyricularia pennisetigena]|uniref:hypothetical protein n=1 Tax=Pyricularia pennisetigena TaxID=1578925 RepID=UPI0011520CCB|nr:hypothetical protein PpBr36_01740 [Pyricularia pennisetigena]TLS27923.1 hypothetical protein PpBr36_01740 [Pyricularia pennisetigena]